MEDHPQIRIFTKNTPFWIQRNFRIVSIEISTLIMELNEIQARNLSDKIVESMSEANAEDYAESEPNTYVEPLYRPKQGEADPMLEPEPINRPIPVQRVNSGSIYETPYSTNVYHDYGGLRIAFDSNNQSRNRSWSLSYMIIALVIGIVIGATVTGLTMHFTSNSVCETEWSEWSECSKRCWGTKVRTNKCLDSKEQIKECHQFPTCPRSGK